MEVRYFHTGKYRFALQLQQRWRTDLARILLGEFALSHWSGVNGTTQIPIFIRLLELMGFLGLSRYRRNPRLWLEPTTKGIATRLIRRGRACDCLEVFDKARDA